MIYKLLNSIQNNHKTNSDNTVFEAQIFSTAQQYILGIVIFAIIITILTTITIYCLYGLTNKNNKIVKCTIIILGIAITITFIILGIIACKAIN